MDQLVARLARGYEVCMCSSFTFWGSFDHQHLYSKDLHEGLAGPTLHFVISTGFVFIGVRFIWVLLLYAVIAFRLYCNLT